MTAVAIYSY